MSRATSLPYSGKDFGMRQLCVLTVAAAIATLTSSCSKPENAQAGAIKDPGVPTVAVAKVASDDLLRDLALTAEFRPFQEIAVMAKVAGYVKKIYVDVGDRVKQNQPLAV